MTDYSVPRGERDDFKPPAGPEKMRQALRLPPRFDEQVLDLARESGWRVFGIGPTWLFIRGHELLVAHIGPAGSTQYDLFASLGRVTRVRHAHWRQVEGMGPVKAALAGDAS